RVQLSHEHAHHRRRGVPEAPARAQDGGHNGPARRRRAGVRHQRMARHRRTPPVRRAAQLWRLRGVSGHHRTDRPGYRILSLTGYEQTMTNADAGAVVRYDGASVAVLASLLGAPRVELLDTVSSTQDVAHELASAGAPAGTLVLANQQTSGRGRHGRTW